MTTRTRVDVAHEASVERDLPGIVGFLKEHLGPNVTAFIAGRDASTVGRWAKGDGQQPSDQIERRLRAAFQVFQTLNEDNSSHVVRAWFIGMNPQLADETPAEVLKDDRHREVMAAARAFKVGG